MPTIPDAIGKYRVIRQLGEGGMGSVYLAHDEGIDRQVAIKLLRADNDSLRRRFQSEAQSAGRLKHSNIVTVYEYGEFDSAPYLVMEFIEGRTVAQIIEHREPVPVEEQLSLLIQACEGLAYAHRCGVVHRDIKPSNLMVDREGRLKIVDFGIARTTERGLTMTGKLVGTPAYMAPEQIQGETADHRSDTFAVGLVVFELLSGQCAYSGDSDYAVINRIVSGRPNTFSHGDPRLERLISPVLARALARDPSQRHQSADQLAADLSSIRARLTTSTPVPEIASSDTQPTILMPVRRRRVGPIAVAAFAVVLFALGAWALWPRTPAVEQDEVSSPAPAPVAVPPVTAAPPTVPEREGAATPAAANIAPAPRPGTPSPAPTSEARSQPPADKGHSARLSTAKTAEESGDYATAIEGYQQVLAADPGNVLATDGLSSARRAQERTRSAVIRGHIADALQKLGDGAYDDAIATFESVLKLDSTNPEALDGLNRARKAKTAEEAVLKSRARKPPMSQ